MNWQIHFKDYEAFLKEFRWTVAAIMLRNSEKLYKGMNRVEIEFSDLTMEHCTYRPLDIRLAAANEKYIALQASELIADHSWNHFSFAHHNEDVYIDVFRWNKVPSRWDAQLKWTMSYYIFNEIVAIVAQEIFLVSRHFKFHLLIKMMFSIRVLFCQANVHLFAASSTIFYKNDVQKKNSIGNATCHLNNSLNNSDI